VTEIGKGTRRGDDRGEFQAGYKGQEDEEGFCKHVTAGPDKLGQYDPIPENEDVTGHCRERGCCSSTTAAVAHLSNHAHTINANRTIMPASTTTRLSSHARFARSRHAPTSDGRPGTW